MKSQYSAAAEVPGVDLEGLPRQVNSILLQMILPGVSQALQPDEIHPHSCLGLNLQQAVELVHPPEERGLCFKGQKVWLISSENYQNRLVPHLTKSLFLTKLLQIWTIPFIRR